MSEHYDQREEVHAARRAAETALTQPAATRPSSPIPELLEQLARASEDLVSFEHEAQEAERKRRVARETVSDLQKKVDKAFADLRPNAMRDTHWGDVEVERLRSQRRI